MQLRYRYSAMNAGKTTSLLQVDHNYLENGGQALLFTSGLDDRAGTGVISSRIGLQKTAEIYSQDTDFLERLDGVEVSCVLIDEAQFLTVAQVKQLHRWVHKANTPVICYGLRTDFQGNAFPGSAALLALADSIEELRTACRCGKKATMNMRIDENGNPVSAGEQVLIGGNNRYRSVCARCFYNTFG